ncbi:ORF84 [Ranid herpesvirus 1]|uniref:ORF84 n=1 Tax=Ranid herpesvirus 1 TaxID=85655 RepID=Q9YQY4_9VIRU|nr:ORF84 [Ranid herpesvirus 1]AAD12281.1 ORF84 [Ranid herpesvirus 1]
MSRTFCNSSGSTADTDSYEAMAAPQNDWVTRDAPLRSLRAMFAMDEQLGVPLTRESLLAELECPKYRVTHGPHGFSADGLATPGLTRLLERRWPEHGKINRRYAKAAPRATHSKHRSERVCKERVFSDCHIAIMTRLLERNVPFCHGIPQVSREILLEVLESTLPRVAPVSTVQARVLGAAWADQAEGLTKNAFRRAWVIARMYAHMGSCVDADLKTAIVQGVEGAKYRETCMALYCLTAHNLEPLATDVAVTTLRTTDVEDELCAQCVVCARVQCPTHYSTEIDVVCLNKENGKVCLVELKCTRNPMPSKEAMRVARTQAWCSWLMFSNTYPKLRTRSESMILTVSLMNTTTPTLTDVMPLTNSHTMRTHIPFIDQWCSTHLAALCPIAKPRIDPYTLSAYKRRSYRYTDSTNRSSRRTMTDANEELENIYETFHELVNECD